MGGDVAKKVLIVSEIESMMRLRVDGVFGR
jgi:hypothetical protein